MSSLNCVSGTILLHRTGTAAQIRHHVSTAFATADGTDGRGGPVGNQPSGTLMLTQTLVSAGIGAQAHPVLVCVMGCRRARVEEGDACMSHKTFARPRF